MLFFGGKRGINFVRSLMDFNDASTNRSLSVINNRASENLFQNYALMVNMFTDRNFALIWSEIFYIMCEDISKIAYWNIYKKILNKFLARR